MTDGPISVRLRDLEPAAGESARKVRDLLRRCPRPEPLPSSTVEAIHARILKQRSLRARRLRPALALAAAAGVALATGALMIDRQGPLALSREPARAAEHAAAASNPALVAPAAANKKAVTEPERPSRTPRRVPLAAPSSVPSAAAPPATSASLDDGLARESQALGGALAALRRDRDPQAALDALDRYAAEFPRGQLAQEASVARVDALLALGRRGEARLLLEQLPLETLPRSVELRLIRGELRGAAGDCADASADYARVLAAAPSPGLAERAEAGRARCRARGDAADVVQGSSREQPAQASPSQAP